MRLFEYDAKQIVSQEGLTIPRGHLIKNEHDIEDAIQHLGLPLVLKVQTLVGGRAKVGGVAVLQTEQDIRDWVNEKMNTVIKGKKVEAILAEQVVHISDEYYVAFSMDTTEKNIKLLFSRSGGIDVEDVKGTSKLYTYKVNKTFGLEDFKLTEILSRSGVPQTMWKEIKKVFHQLYTIFLKYDCTLLEVNPLAINHNSELSILDVHFYVDDNAIPRQPAIRNVIYENSIDYSQLWHKLEYGYDTVILDTEGTIGLLSTGAGLSMALTDELINQKLRPINFADVRSGQLKGDPTRLVVLLNQLKKFPNIKCVFVSIFAGITDLAEFSESLLEAKKHVELPKDLDWVVRFEGVNYEKAKEMLEKDGLFVTNSLMEALSKIHQVSKV
ncbi:ATP-grasp domain-containing protein [Salirhabdus salicampi]|uniref:ATP-grasp domain-containing protein n=1 Tax=Salirhabdus salicampi TaxID=476102 RepID=UPI0020C21219|nr:ATP-grasp domain-containing protein [Salirhabdus salicampi]MCP8615657.1 acetate--CoA ligase family protein [Salirhabdus salicampi]